MLMIHLVFSLLSTARAVLVIPPPMPHAWPSLNPTSPWTRALLDDPLVADAIAHVNSVVPASLLNIAPSISNGSAATTYPAAAAQANCHWPRNQCTAHSYNSAFENDLVTCPEYNDWSPTFDDGPSISASGIDTTGLLTALNSANRAATFFVIGSNVASAPQILRNTFNAGHLVASHTWSHRALTSQTNEQIVAEIKYTEAMIYQTIGRVPKYIRPPYGDVDDRVRAIFSALGYRNVLWTTNPPRDSQDTTTATNIRQVIRSWFVSQAGFISLQHDIVPATTSIAIDTVHAIIADASFPLHIKTVAQCIGDQNGYQDHKAIIITQIASSTRPLPVTSTSVQTLLSAPTDKATSGNMLVSEMGLLTKLAMLALAVLAL